MHMHFVLIHCDILLIAKHYSSSKHCLYVQHAHALCADPLWYPAHCKALLIIKALPICPAVLFHLLSALLISDRILSCRPSQSQLSFWKLRFLFCSRIHSFELYKQCFPRNLLLFISCVGLFCDFRTVWWSSLQYPCHENIHTPINIAWLGKVTLVSRSNRKKEGHTQQFTYETKREIGYL